MTEKESKDFQAKLDKIFQKQLEDPEYRKAHCLSLSEN